MPLTATILIGVIALAQPAPFTEEGADRGVAMQLLDDPPFDGIYGWGMAFADLDNDGDPDLIQTGSVTGDLGLFENDGTGHFTNRNDPPVLPNAIFASSVTAADYDADGDLDVLVNVWQDRDLLLRNDGNFVFTDVAADALLLDEGPSLGCSWADYNGDGWLDLYLPHRTGSLIPPFPPLVESTEQNRLMRNNGNGTFTDVAQTLGVTDTISFALQSGMFDMDRDGDPEIYTANDKGPDNCALLANKVFRNDGGVFTDYSAASGADGCMYGMSVTVGDFDRDLDEDIYVTNLDGLGNHLYLNQGNCSFQEQAALTGTQVNQTGWGAVFFDYDNDAHLELYVCNVSRFTTNNMFDHDGVFPAQDITAAVGLDQFGEVTYTVAAADVDNDGDQDLAVAAVDLPLRLFINNEGQQRNWIKLRVRGRAPNLFAVGSTVDIRTGGVWQTRQIIAGSNFKAQNELTLHVGLDDATLADEVVVRWPDGEMRTFGDLAGNQTWTLSPLCACDYTQDDIVDVLDLLEFLGIWFDPTSDPERADFDGQAPAGDVLDLLAFLGCWFPASDGAACP